MSYQLIFLVRPETDFSAVRAHFAGRPNFTIADETADYANELTGVTFTVDIGPPKVDQERDSLGSDNPELDGPSVDFFVNYFRPRTYLREVIPEITSFLTNFPSRFYDEVTDEIGAFSPEVFENSWDRTNAGTVRSWAQKESFEAWFAPAALIEAAWSWNYETGSLQNELGEDIFVPLVNWHTTRSSPTLRTFVIWPDAIPIVIPVFVSDAVLIRVIQPAGSIFQRLFGRQPEPDYAARLVPMGDIQNRLALPTTMAGKHPIRRFADDRTGFIKGIVDEANQNAEDCVNKIHPMSVFEDDLKSPA